MREQYFWTAFILNRDDIVNFLIKNKYNNDFREGICYLFVFNLFLYIKILKKSY